MRTYSSQYEPKPQDERDHVPGRKTNQAIKRRQDAEPEDASPSPFSHIDKCPVCPCSKMMAVKGKAVYLKKEKRGH